MKTFGKILASVGAIVLVGTLTLGAVSYASAQDTTDNNTPSATQQQQPGNGPRFGNGPMGWFAQRFGGRIHEWMSEHWGNGPMQGMMGRMGGMGGGMMGGRFGQAGEMLTTVAKALNMSEADLRAALVDGKSIADLAAEKKVDLQTIINAIMAEAKTRLDAAVSSGQITQERADQMLANMAQMLPEHLNQPFAPGNGMMGSGLNWGPAFERGFNMLGTVAKTLDMSDADLLSAVQSGKTVAVIAKEKNVDLQKVIDAILAERKTQLDAAVAAGTITQARADLMLQNMKENLPDRLNQPMGQGMGNAGQRGMRHGRGMGGMWNK
ncbi:MAG: hypothetical protein U0175_06290 [Caldilineaceae bacterium]